MFKHNGLYHYNVDFTPLGNCQCHPPIAKGIRDHVWVTTKTRRKSEIETAARDLMVQCYGVEIKDLIHYQDKTLCYKMEGLSLNFWIN